MNGHVSSRSVSRLATIAFAIAAFALNANAYRPFDGTDASVAEDGVFELEAGAGHVHFGDVDSVALPSLVFNYGLPWDTEIVIEGQFNRELGHSVDGPRNRFGDTQLSMKHVFVKGSLQDLTGPSVATECAVLLPEVHGSSGTGAECAAIVSNKWDALALHFNAGIGRTREHDIARTVSLIAEGPETWPVRPVAEILAERDNGGGRLKSALVGAIWRHADDMVFDVAFRRARTNDSAFNEIRLGLTWSFAAGK